jgi:uncharacterized caspase-like protein
MHHALHLGCVCLGLLVAALPHTAFAQDRAQEGTPDKAEAKRVALVIGNSAYRSAPVLRNPRNDAADMAAALRRLGYRVIEAVDLDKAAMDATLQDFTAALAGAEQGVFFYAGHGLQVGGENFLVPIDAGFASPSALETETVRLDAVQRGMEQAAKFSVLFLDACRDNPLALALAAGMGVRPGDMARGLASTTSGLGTLISFSTQPGNVALDGQGRNSPFAAALVKRIAEPDSDLSTILINVRNDVVRATEARQVPWEHSSLWSRFYLNPAADPANAVASAKPATDQRQELALWSGARDSGDVEQMRAFVRRNPGGDLSGPALMSIARTERWNERDARPAAWRRSTQDDVLPPIRPGWQMPRTAEADARCRRIYALLTARVREARLQCGPPR